MRKILAGGISLFLAGALLAFVPGNGKCSSGAERKILPGIGSGIFTGSGNFGFVAGGFTNSKMAGIMLAHQGAEIDAMTGAVWSSQAVIQAVKNAFEPTAK